MRGGGLEVEVENLLPVPEAPLLPPRHQVHPEVGRRAVETRRRETSPTPTVCETSKSATTEKPKPKKDFSLVSFSRGSGGLRNRAGLLLQADR